MGNKKITKTKVISLVFALLILFWVIAFFLKDTNKIFCNIMLGEYAPMPSGETWSDYRPCLWYFSPGKMEAFGK